MAGAGIETVYLKGFANAHTLYTDPDVRTVGDVDVLVRNDDLDRVIQLLSSRGFRFRGAAERSWGFISTASYVPFVSADGACNLDIHIQPDAYPVYRSLTADDMFAASRETNADTLPFRVPCAEHNLILSASNAAKDKFGPFCARKLVDAIVLLQTESHIDWSQIEVIARNGRFLRPVQVFLALLRRLGAPVTAASSGLDLSSKGLVAAEFERTFRDYRDLFPHTPGVLALLRRELLVCTEPSVGLYNSWLRLRGLVRPQSGIPPGARDLMQSST